MPVISPSSAFTDSLRYGSTLVTTRLTVYKNGVATQYLAPTSTVSVTVDRNSNYRRSGSITIELPATVPPATLAPTGPGSILAPFGTEVFVEMGLNTGAMSLYASASVGAQSIQLYNAGSVQAGNTVQVGSGANAQSVIVSSIQGVDTPVTFNLAAPLTTSWAAGTAVQLIEFCPIGLLDIATTSVDDTVNDYTVTLDVYDRSWVISRRKLVQPYNVPCAVQNHGTFLGELQALLNTVWGQDPAAPPLIFSIDSAIAGLTVPSATYAQGADPWVDIALTMATAVGAELFFDVYGNVTAFATPDPTTTPVTWNFTDDVTSVYGGPGQGSAGLLGSPYSTPVECQSQMTADGIYNDIWVTGQGTPLTPGSGSTSTAPVQGRVFDSNPSSATYVGGGLGDVPNFISSNMVLTSNQANTTAGAELQIALSAAWTVTLSINPTPFLDIDDIVVITRPRVFGLNNPQKVVIDTITHALRYADLSQITGRVVPATQV